MNKNGLVILMALFALAPPVLGSEKARYVDSKGCMLSNGGETVPTISFIVGAYVEENFPKSKIKLLLKDAEIRGCDVNAYDARGHTALHMAVLDGSLDVVKALLELGADPSLEIKRPGSVMNGVDVYTYAQMLARDRPSDSRWQVIDALDTYKLHKGN